MVLDSVASERSQLSANKNWIRKDGKRGENTMIPREKVDKRVVGE